MPRPRSVLANWSVRMVYMPTCSTRECGYASRFDMGVHVESRVYLARARRRSPAPRPQIPRGDAWNSNEWTAVRKSRGRNRRGANERRRAKMNYGGMRRKMLRASICSRTFPRPASGEATSVAASIGMQFRKKKKKEEKEGKCKTSVRSTVFQYAVESCNAHCCVKWESEIIWRRREDPGNPKISKSSSHRIRRSRWNNRLTTNDNYYSRINGRVQWRNVAALLGLRELQRDYNVTLW